MNMKTLALAMAAAATLVFTAPSFAASAPDRVQLAQADVTVKKVTRSEDGMRKKVVIRHREGGERRMHREVRMHRDYGRHEGWRHRHHDGRRVVIIKKYGGGKTVIKKKIEG